eukprot:jgi/Tetstr1/439228/TSEL_027670.t1
MAHIIHAPNGNRPPALPLGLTGLTTMHGDMGVDSMFAAAEEQQHLVAFMLFAGPLAARMYRMRGILAASLYQQLAHLEESPLPWAKAMRAAWIVA